MTKSPKVSIIIPIYNTEKYLKRCLDSILEQTYQNLEIILVDDGSTDDSGKMIDNYSKKDKRIKVIHQENHGQSNARNNGLKKATGDYISFVDGDDYLAKTFIEKLLAPFLADQNTSLSVCGIRYKHLKQNLIKDAYIKRLRQSRPKESLKAYILYLLTIDGRIYSSVNKLYRSSIAKDLKFDESINFAEDTKFVLNYIKATSSTDLKFILEPLYIYNYGTETSTISSTATDWKNWQNQYKDLKSWLGKNLSLREKFWRNLVYARWHVSYYLAKRRQKA